MSFTADNQLIVLCIAPQLYEGYYRVVPRLYRDQFKIGYRTQKELPKPNDADTGIEFMNAEARILQCFIGCSPYK